MEQQLLKLNSEKALFYKMQGVEEFDLTEMVTFWKHLDKFVYLQQDLRYTYSYAAKKPVLIISDRYCFYFPEDTKVYIQVSSFAGTFEFYNEKQNLVFIGKLNIA